MSHFSVLVITPDCPTEASLKAVLQPWHEFECTGCDDQYVQDIDKTVELQENYEASKRTMLTAPDGSLHKPYGDEFYRDVTPEEEQRIGPLGGTGAGRDLSWTSRDWGDGRGYRTKVRFIPDGYAEVEVPCLHLMTFREFVASETSDSYEVPFGSEPDMAGRHKYGLTFLNADGTVDRVIDLTNPNKHWDWWQIGGRFSAMLIPRYDPRTDPRNIETCFVCQGTGKRDDMECRNGCNGCAGAGTQLKLASRWIDCGNQAALADIDVAGLRAEAERSALAQYDKRIAVVAGRPIPDIDALREAHGIDKARDLFWGDPVIKDLRAAGENWLEKSDIDELRTSRDVVAQRARNGALSTFAVVKDGQWFERGSMGWWGCASSEKDRDAWDAQVSELLAGLTPTTWLTVVDCHI